MAICGLLILLTFSYRQTIFAIPAVGVPILLPETTLDNHAQVAGASLLIDYILTVVVSIASGVDQMASIFPLLFAYKVQISLLLILLITFVNLRGVKNLAASLLFPPICSC